MFYIRWDATMEFLIIHRFKTMFSNCKTILSISMHRKKKNIAITEMNFNNWLQLILEKRILCQDSNSITVLTRIHWLDRRIVRKQLDIMPTYYYVQNQGKLMIMQVEKMAKNLNLGNFWRHFREYLQIKNFFQKSGSVTFLPL